MTHLYLCHDTDRHSDTHVRGEMLACVLRRLEGLAGSAQEYMRDMIVFTRRCHQVMIALTHSLARSLSLLLARSLHLTRSLVLFLSLSRSLVLSLSLARSFSPPRLLVLSLPLTRSSTLAYHRPPFAHPHPLSLSLLCGLSHARALSRALTLTFAVTLSHYCHQRSPRPPISICRKTSLSCSPFLLSLQKSCDLIRYTRM